MAARVSPAHFETLYEVLWNYSVTLRVMSKQHAEAMTSEGSAMDAKNRSLFREVFYAELLSTLIVMLEKRERRAEGKKGSKKKNMFKQWQDEGNRKVISRELFSQARQNGETQHKKKREVLAEIKTEVKYIYEQAAGDLYKMVCGGKDAIVELLQGVVRVVRMNIPEDNEAVLCKKLTKLRNKINFLIAIVENYGGQEPEVARPLLQRDMLSQFSETSSTENSISRETSNLI